MAIHVDMSIYRFLEECGSELRTLRLACCRYISKQTLSTIGKVCPNLEGQSYRYNLEFGVSLSKLHVALNCPYTCCAVCMLSGW